MVSKTNYKGVTARRNNLYRPRDRIWHDVRSNVHNTVEYLFTLCRFLV